MNCVICKGSNIELKMVDEQIRSGKDIVLVPINKLTALGRTKKKTVISICYS